MNKPKNVVDELGFQYPSLDELTWNTFKYVAERLGHDKFTTITTADSFTVRLDDGRSASGTDLDAIIAQLKGSP